MFNQQLHVGSIYLTRVPIVLVSNRAQLIKALTLPDCVEYQNKAINLGQGNVFANLHFLLIQGQPFLVK